MRLIYLYHPDEPLRGSIAPGTLPRQDLATHGVVALQLRQRHVDGARRSESVRSLELRNSDVPVPMVGKSLKWCRFFEMSDFNQKHHMIKVSLAFRWPYVNIN